MSTAWPDSGADILFGVGGNALATALYIGAQLGPGPRDGLMTGLHRRTGVSIRLVRTCLEVTVVVIGWALGLPAWTIIWLITSGWRAACTVWRTSATTRLRAACSSVSPNSAAALLATSR